MSAFVKNNIVLISLRRDVEKQVLGYDLVRVSNPGNAGHTQQYTWPQVSTLTFGAVNYNFWIGKYHVTIGQYAEFLNSVASLSDPYDLYFEDTDTQGMFKDQRTRGIERVGEEGGWVYIPAGPVGTNSIGAQSTINRPVTHISWFNAARFANWMSNGKPNGVAGSSTTENGAYDLVTQREPTNTAPAKNTINPNTDAPPTFYIPTENEWYKAAYYDPTKDGVGGYWSYATGRFENGIYAGSSEIPGNGWNGTLPLANKDIPNQANYRFDNSRYAVTGSTDSAASGRWWIQNLLTDVGTFTNSYSYYRAFDMTGNVFECNDLDNTTINSRGLRGGSYHVNAVLSSSAYRSISGPQVGLLGPPQGGFRLASI